VIRTGIITAPRPRPTLLHSLKSYRRAGFDNDVLVFAEPGVDPVTADKVHYLPNEVKLGNLRNWHRALSVLTSGFEAGDDWILICEDDISWARDAASQLIQSLIDLKNTNLLRTAGALSLYLPRRHTKHFGHRLKDGWYALGQGPKTWGFQAMVMTQSQARSLLESSQFRGYLADPSLDKNIDKFVGKTVQDAGKTILYRVPCLVDHDVGDGNSSLGYADVRPDLKTDYFRGPKA
jgi:hypothetical protein